MTARSTEALIKKHEPLTEPEAELVLSRIEELELKEEEAVASVKAERVGPARLWEGEPVQSALALPTSADEGAIAALVESRLEERVNELVAAELDKLRGQTRTETTPSEKNETGTNTEKGSK